MFSRSIILLLTLLVTCFACKDTNSGETQKTTEAESEVQIPEEEPGVFIYSWVDNLRVREKPDTKSPIIIEVKEGTELEYLEQKTDFTQKINLRGTVYDEPWLKIKTLDQKEGWVYGGAVKFYRPTIDSGPSPYDKCFSIGPENYARRSKCIKTTSAEQLKKDVDHVKSGPGGLTFNLLGGEQKQMISKKGSDEANNVSYDYRYYLPKMGYFVVRANYFEGNEYLLVNDKSGKEMAIKGYPKPSPDFKHLIVTCGERNDYTIPTDVQLLGFTENGLEIIWERNLEDYIAIKPIWKDENNLEFLMKHTEDKEEDVKASLSTTLDGKWVFSKYSNE